MSLETLLPWATTVFGVLVLYLAGRARTRRLAWCLGLCNQLAWCSYAVIAGAHGFIAGSAIYFAVYMRNLLRGE